MRTGDDFLELSRFYTDVIQAPGGTLPFLVSAEGGPIAGTLFAGQDYELDTMKMALDAITGGTGANPLAGRGLIDVGANVGTTSVYAVKHFDAAWVVGLEPSELNAALAKCNAILNGVDDKVSVLHGAATNTDGTVQLGLSANQPADHRVVRTGGERKGQSRPIPELATVPALKLDTLEVDRASLGLIWMDVQGHEGHVLDGARELLQIGPPVVAEYWPEALNRSGGLELFEESLTENYTHFADAMDGFRPRPISDLRSLRSTYHFGTDESEVRGEGWTDVAVWRSP